MKVIEKDESDQDKIGELMKEIEVKKAIENRGKKSDWEIEDPLSNYVYTSILAWSNLLITYLLPGEKIGLT